MRERCLIVDDNERFLEVATSSLSREGFEIVGSAKTRDEAIEAARTLDPNVVLVDVNLDAGWLGSKAEPPGTLPTAGGVSFSVVDRTLRLRLRFS